jgi:hypothetical protein
MIAHKAYTKVNKKGYLELKNLPFKVWTKLEVIISKRDRSKNLQNLISNDHVWSEEDIEQSYRPDPRESQ